MSPSLTFWSAAARFVLALLAGAYLLLALGGVLLHGWIVPRIDQFRPQLEALALKATGLRVEIGAIAARGGGIFPTFELQQVRLLDANGQPALLLPQVVTAISPRSLMTLGLEQLVIRDADLDIRRTADGRWFLAGLPVAAKPTGGSALADWLLSQQEWALFNGTVRWTDERQGVSLVLTAVDAVMRNPGHRHLLRLDATPPADWGDRVSLRGQFRHPLLSRSPSDLQQWSGELYGQASRIDLAPLQAYAQLAGMTLGKGQGALRAWLDVSQGRVVGATADVALQGAVARLAPQLPPLAFRQVHGRVAWSQPSAQGLDLRTEALSFDTAEGLHWPGGNLTLKLALDAEGQPTGGQLRADRLDLAALAAVAERLPQSGPWRNELLSLAPQGLVTPLELNWQGPLSAPQQLSAQGQVQGLALAADPNSGRPGVAGLNLDFKIQREGGEDKVQATLLLQRGWLEFPSLFADPRLTLDRLSGELRLKRSARGLEVELRQAQLADRDAQGQFQVRWTQAAGGPPLGLLDLQGQLSRGDAARVWRYLPTSLPESVRHYVRDAVTQGQLSEVRFKVKGPLASFPFDKANDGEFQVSARLRNAGYQYVPLGASSRPWPALAQLDADLLFDKASLQVLKGQARVAGHPNLLLSKAEAHIAHLGNDSVVEVSGEFKGPLAQGIALVNRSPLAEMTSQALARATGTGTGELQLKLSLPLAELSRSKVQGSLPLTGNDLQLSPDTPVLSRLRGRLNFTEAGFQVSGAQARMLGGDVRFEGGLRSPRPGESELVFRGQGTASAEGLAQWRELAAMVPGLGRASGSANYTATVGFRQGALELNVASNLVGLGLALPEPLNKVAQDALPLLLEKTVQRDTLSPGKRLQDRLALTLGPGAGLEKPLKANYLRDIGGPQAQVLSGQISLGGEREAEATPREVRAQVQLPRLDLDAWEPLLRTSAQDNAAGLGPGYLPTVYSLRAGRLRMEGHTFQDLQLSGRREGSTWRGNVSASELNGYAEYRESTGATPGRLYARLARLSLGASSAGEVENLLGSQPSSIPALDIVVDELELRGKRMGRLEVEAINRAATARDAREWRLSKLNLVVPEARLSATGTWAALPAPRSGQRATQLNFKLDVSDSGELLKRLGLDGALRRGKGKLEGQLGWTGSPLALHTPSMNGQLTLDLESGQFLKAEPGVAKLLGVLNLQALPRRLTLDFRDVFSDGFAFDTIRGDVTIQQGVASTRNLRMKGVNAVVLMDGLADIVRETQDLRVVVVPEINAGTASLLAYAVNPTVGLSTLLAQWLLRQPLHEVTTQEFHIRGPWQDPQIQKVSRQRNTTSTETPPATPEAKP